MKEGISRDIKNANVIKMNMSNVCSYENKAGKRGYAAEVGITPQTPTGKARRGSGCD